MMTIERQIIMPGHKVRFTYKHYLNSKSYTNIVKEGVVIRAVRSKNDNYRPTGFFMIKFPDNKTLSKLHESRILNLTLNP